MTKLVPSEPDSMLSALSNFNLRPDDTFKIAGSKGVLSMHRRRPDGRVDSLRVRANGCFKQATQFDPANITIDERRNLVAEMYKSKLSQSEIADLIGVSQATISLDLRNAKKRNK